MANLGAPDKGEMAAWLESLAGRDPALHAELAPLRAPLVTEGMGGPPPAPAMELETIVRKGRPALLIQGGRIDFGAGLPDELSDVVVQRLKDGAAAVEPLIPLVGRIDVANHPAGFSYVGTGWLVAEDLVVTNRHVAELIARAGAEGFSFIPGRFGQPLNVEINWRREFGLDGEGAKVEAVKWINPDPRGADVAFLKVARQADGLTPKFIPLAVADLPEGRDVVVVGYPARAPDTVIPDQDWMERLYGGVYDVKRIAPGLMGQPDPEGWATHDCTTLGGNSGSVVLDLATGQAVALHFAGRYMVTNYAVPASTMARYLKAPPWLANSVVVSGGEAAHGAVTVNAAAGSSTTVTVNVPITLTVTVGQPTVGQSVGGGGQGRAAVETAVEAYGRRPRPPGQIAVKAGLVVEAGALVDAPCIVVAVDPLQIAAVRAAAPAEFMGYPVQVRAASIDDQLGMTTEAPGQIAYDDDARTGSKFRLDWIEKPMRVVCHVGPERGFEQLLKFMSERRGDLTSSMYQFYADHVRQAVETALSATPAPKIRLVLDPKTRDGDGPTPAGQFNRKATFDDWKARFGLKRIFVPEGNGGLVDNAYHIKVTVRGDKSVWLSSGNWTRTSQPLIAPADRMNPSKTAAAGNREWHVIAESRELARVFKAHIEQDFARCAALGGGPEAPAGVLFVDVPVGALEAVVLEAPPAKVFEPLEVSGTIRVCPLLTPDRKGGAYCDKVLELIERAEHQLLFQNQYIKVTPASTGRFGELVDALARASQRVADCRIILRSGDAALFDNVAELKRRGVNVATQVRRLTNTHTKGIVVDGKRVLVGSHNWSASGVTFNRDASLIFEGAAEIAGYYAGVFEADWARATALTAPPPAAPGPHALAPRIAEGAAPPPGFVRMPLADWLEG